MHTHSGNRNRGSKREIEQIPIVAYYWAAIGLHGLAAVFLLLGKHRLALFAGLWSPVLLLLVLLNRQERAAASSRRHEPLDRTEAMSADSFPASDPPAGPATLGPQREPTE